MILTAKALAQWLDVPYGDVATAMTSGHRYGPHGRREYERIDAAVTLQDWYRRRIAENEDGYAHSPSGMYLDRIHKFKARLAKVRVCEEAWRREDRESQEG